MSMVNATYAKQNFGACIADASKEPLVIEKSGRPSVVMLAYEEYRRLADQDNLLLLERAQSASEEGYLTAEETQKSLRERVAKIIL
jgi:PHD/YefM family antitoxin component YafN of YafNO toxin-antitoxin module